MVQADLHRRDESRRMVGKALAILILAASIVGCKDEAEKNAQRSAPMTIDQRIAELEKRTDMPDEVKQQTIASLRQQQQQQQSAQK